jgi:hypothetical protein
MSRISKIAKIDFSPKKTTADCSVLNWQKKQKKYAEFSAPGHPLIVNYFYLWQWF